MFKMIVFYQRPDDEAAFIKRFKEGHVPLLQKLPGVVGVHLNVVTKALMGEVQYWAYSETCFPTQDEFKLAMKSPEMLACGQDVMQFAAGKFTVTTGYEEALA